MGRDLRRHNSRTKRARTLQKLFAAKRELKQQQELENQQIEATAASETLLQNKETPTSQPYDVDPNGFLQGHRIVDLHHVLNWALKLQFEHYLECNGKLTVTNEKRLGLSSKLNFVCDTCPYQVWKSTENEVNPVINKAAVWGTVSSGATYAKLRNLLGVLNISSLCYDTYSKIEKDIYKSLQGMLTTSMQSAAAKERELAISKNQLDSEGKPWVTTGVDGGWCRRSYGHSYNAKSGTAVIVGTATKKILYLGTKNMFCLTCLRSKNKNQEPPKHECYKNWNSSSGAMESAIIVEGFNRSVPDYDMKYLKFVADGDSNVLSKIRTECSYGAEVSKIECKNHILKNYGKALYTLSKKTAVPVKARKKLNVTKIKALQSICSTLFRIHAGKDAELLKKDMLNSHLHVYGNHESCMVSYCKDVGTIAPGWISVERTGLLNHIQEILERYVKKAPSLIENETNNISENFMSLLCKFISGKRINMSSSGMFNGRVYAAALRYNEGPGWLGKAWQTISGQCPGLHLTTFLNRLESEDTNFRNARKRAQDRLENEKPKRRRRGKQQQEEQEYGPNIADSFPDAAKSDESGKNQIQSDCISIQGENDEPNIEISECSENNITISEYSEVVVEWSECV